MKFELQFIYFDLGKAIWKCLENGGRFVLASICSTHKKKPYTPPSRASYGMSFMRICEKNDHDIMAPLYVMLPMAGSTLGEGLELSGLISFIMFTCSGWEIYDENRASLKPIWRSNNHNTVCTVFYNTFGGFHYWCYDTHDENKFTFKSLI